MSRYEALTDQLRGLPGVASIGTSVEGRELWCASFGEGESRILLTGGLHGREWVGTDFLSRVADAWSESFPYSNLCVELVPLINPDGMTVAEAQLDRPHKERQKSNAHGVDLNRNFDADWNTRGVDALPSFSDGNYPGSAPFSEPETQAIRELVEEMRPTAVLDWHCRGGLLDVEHGGPETLKLAHLMMAKNGYKLVPRMHYEASGTFGDWLRRDDPDRSIVTIEITTETDPEWDRNWPALQEALEHLDAQ